MVRQGQDNTMIERLNSIGIINTNIKTQGVQAKQAEEKPFVKPYVEMKNAPLTFMAQPNGEIRTVLIGNEIQKYNELQTALMNQPVDKSGISEAKKLDELLKNGKLLNKTSNDKTTTLDNLYNILTLKRLDGFNSLNILNQTINAIYNPKIITQKFGDIPKEIKGLILVNPETAPYIKENPTLLDVDKHGSGTCPAASLEFNMANKSPAEFARWVEGLTSPNVSVKQKIDMNSLNKNFLDAHWLIKDAFELKYDALNFDKAQLTLKPDKNALQRAFIQNGYYDNGERTVIDVLIQSTLMQIASQQTYDSLTDIRAGKFNSNPQGLSEFEKTFVESIVTNKEKLSIVYQNIDDNQYLKGYRCPFDKIEKHIKNAIDNGENVIIGYIFTGPNNKVKGGHEITIVDYKEKMGKTVFICNDTDDDKEQYVEYAAEYLLPKIHHAGYDAKLVENETDLLAIA